MKEVGGMLSYECISVCVHTCSCCVCGSNWCTELRGCVDGGY